MSRNGSYAKSMNGIVSFDDGDGTVIEGDGITTGIIDCTTLNASSTVNTSQLFADFIGINQNTEISVISNTTFSGNIKTDYIYATSGSEIIINNNTSITGTLTTTLPIQTPTIEGRGIGGTGSPLKIGQSNDYTSSVDIGRAEITAGGVVFPAIPARTTYYPLIDSDIANKYYVDSSNAGTNILSLENTFTGTTNTFQNLNANGNITASTFRATGGTFANPDPAANCRFASLTTTGGILIGFLQTTGILSLGVDNTRTGEIRIGAPGCNTICRSPFIANLGIKLPTATNSIDTDTSTSTISLFNSLTSGTLNIANGSSSSTQINIGKGVSSTSQINLGISDFYGNATCRSAFFVDSISARTTSLFNYTIYDTINTNSTITLGSSDIGNESQTYISRNNGTLRIASTAFRNGNVNICDGANFGGAINIITNPTQTSTNTINLGSTLTNVNICNTDAYSRTINLANTNAGIGVMTTNTINIGSNMSNINIGNVSGNTQRTIRIGNTSSNSTNQMGNVIMGKGANNLTTSNNGTVTINKLQVGVGTSNRCVITGFTGAGLGGIQNFTIPGAPTTLGYPFIFTQMIAPLNGFIYSVQMNVTGFNSFQYQKRYQAGGVTNDATLEDFYYMAVWQ
jgi:hypothetical protein